MITRGLRINKKITGLSEEFYWSLSLLRRIFGKKRGMSELLELGKVKNKCS
jgi:hypothetical protein